MSPKREPSACSVHGLKRNVLHEHSINVGVEGQLRTALPPAPEFANTCFDVEAEDDSRSAFSSEPFRPAFRQDSLGYDRVRVRRKEWATPHHTELHLSGSVGLNGTAYFERPALVTSELAQERKQEFI